MTQFMLCVPVHAVALSHLAFRLIGTREEWLLEAAQALFPGERTVQIPYMKSGQSIHDLLSEAHDALYNGGDFSDTRLGLVLPEMVRGCKSFALWWANDWSELTIANTEQEVVSELINQLSTPVGEVYLHWSRESSRGHSPPSPQE